MKLDRVGNLFATGPGGLYVFAADGTRLGTILSGVPTSNCAWGGHGHDLFITADAAIFRLRLTTSGVGLNASPRLGEHAR